MNYVIADLSGKRKYIKSEVSGKFTAVTNLQQANQYQSREKAQNVLDNAIKLAERKKWVVMSSAEAEVRRCRQSNKDTIATSESTYEFKWIDRAKELNILYNSIKVHKELMESELAKVNAEILDLEHWLEFHTFSAAQGYKISKMIKEARLKRRQYKDELMRIQIFCESSLRSNMDGTTIKRLEGLERRVYEPRVLKELFL